MSDQRAGEVAVAHVGNGVPGRDWDCCRAERENAAEDLEPIYARAQEAAAKLAVIPSWVVVVIVNATLAVIEETGWAPAAPPTRP